MPPEHILFVNKTCTGCKQALKVIANPRFTPHIQVIEMSEPGARTLMNEFGVLTVPTLVWEPGGPVVNQNGPWQALGPLNKTSRKYMGSGQILGALQTAYREPAVAASGQVGRSFMNARGR